MISVMLKQKGEPVYLQQRAESPAAENLKLMAEQKQGVAWIASMRLGRARDDRRLVQAGDDSWRIPVDITIFRANGLLPAVAENFWAQVEAC